MGYYSCLYYHRECSFNLVMSVALTAAIQSFIFFGFLVAGEEIESAFISFWFLHIQVLTEGTALQILSGTIRMIS